VLTIEPMLEHGMLESLRPGEHGAFLALDADRAEAVVGHVAHLAEAAEQMGIAPVLVCSPQLRPALHRLIRAGGRRVPVLSYTEIAGHGGRIETMGVVSGAYAGAR
jgi:flagellar biosynthesis protein FlhA